VKLRSWLWRNFLRRGLRPLGTRAQKLLFGSLLLPSLLPRAPSIVSDAQDSPGGVERDTGNGRDAGDERGGHDERDRRIEREGREVRVAAQERVRLDTSYADWVAPLARLPRGATPEEFRRAVEGLPGHDPEGQHFFPVAAYLDALRHVEGRDIELTHRLRATRRPSVDFLLSLLAPSSTPAAHAVEPAVLLVSTRPTRPDPPAAER
jgi:hypothetical protein